MKNLNKTNPNEKDVKIYNLSTGETKNIQVDLRRIDNEGKINSKITYNDTTTEGLHYILFATDRQYKTNNFNGCKVLPNHQRY
jgi:5-hydroxyisourate hydrolase-like protein (transthyretin family)